MLIERNYSVARLVSDRGSHHAFTIEGRQARYLVITPNPNPNPNPNPYPDQAEIAILPPPLALALALTPNP